jgi:NAD(P)-dependent dehydrogenase (short-subunit alcohol dehydrogenase family)
METNSSSSTVALITGGGRGIGRMVAVDLARAGIAVGVIARSESDLAETAAMIYGAGGVGWAAMADVTNASDLRKAIGVIRRALGPIDLLVNNAGIVGPIGPLWEVDSDEWWQTFDVNLRGTVLASQMVIPEMVATGKGRVINMSSQAGVHRWPLVSAYSVSKAAIAKLTENVAHETRRHGVSVFSVHPGLLPVGMSETIERSEPTTAYEAHIRAWTLNELAKRDADDPRDAVALIRRLASGDADVLSGRHLSVRDDLDALLEHHNEVRDRDLYVLRPERLDRAALITRRSA